jgi:hypothetical protein
MRGLLLVCLLVPALASAAVYKIVNEDGSVTYSDRPQQGAEELKVAPVQTYQSQPVPTGGATEEAEFSGYDVFEVVSPENDQTFRDEGGTIPIMLRLEPGLHRDHVINIFMDGEDLGGNGRSTSLTLQNVDRGTHSVHAVIVDQDGKQLAATNTVAFHLHRTSKLSP